MLSVGHSTRGKRSFEISRIDFGVEVWLKALCFRHKQLLILPGEPGSRLARARVRGVVDAVRLGGNDQKRTEALLPVLAPVHGSLCLRRRDVGEAARATTCFRIFNVTSTSLQRERPRRFSAFLCSPWGTRQGEDALPKTSRIEFGVEVRLKALCFDTNSCSSCPANPGPGLRVRGCVAS